VCYDSVLDVDATTLAEQLTLHEFETFQGEKGISQSPFFLSFIFHRLLFSIEIVPTEMSHQAWSKNDGAKAPNVMKLIK
jgi:hypothetical protein